jgi:hypothetical protein
MRTSAKRRQRNQNQVPRRASTTDLGSLQEALATTDSLQAFGPWRDGGCTSGLASSNTDNAWRKGMVD